ncbi:MAG: hypothetical protein EOM80_02735 [Erysipelotrichia bacterium]|nr:hypothetical protein [Candidatus Riflebacteria bacterium]NCB37663.1 hypothetical protein [Erysipelotrichia bacterium]
MNRRGFSLYLTFLVTTVVFILVSGSQEISRIVLDTAKSEASETIAFHAADGGLERGLAQLRQSFAPFLINYKSPLGPYRHIITRVEAKTHGQFIDLRATSDLYEGNRLISTRTLARIEIRNQTGRSGSGKFVEGT